MDKKGQLQLDTIRTVMVVFLVIAVLAVAIILSLVNLTDVADNIDRSSSTINNETVTTVTTITENLAESTKRDVGCTLVAVTNATGGEVINAANYTFGSACTIVYSGPTGTNATYNNTNWNVSYTSNYANTGTSEIQGNVTSGISSFFSNTGTIFSILIVIVIILAIAIIIVAVRRFSGNAGGGL